MCLIIRAQRCHIKYGSVVSILSIIFNGATFSTEEISIPPQKPTDSKIYGHQILKRPCCFQFCVDHNQNEIHLQFTEAAENLHKLI